MVRTIGASSENLVVETWDNEAIKIDQKEDKSVGPLYKLMKEKPTWEQVSH